MWKYNYKGDCILTEEWRDIKGFEGLYQISNFGNVKSLGRLSLQKHWIEEKILRTSHAQAGYVDVSLYKNGKRYHKKPHKLVAEAFIPNPKNLPEVEHKDQENCMNPLRRKLLSEINTGRETKHEWFDSKRIKVIVMKDGKDIHTFESYSDMDKNSKDIFGVTLWNVYVRKVVKGIMPDYHGYTFRIQ